ncbi:hypothetical protein [Paraburkholderia sp. ZP32-5]|uniref:hypothetical protein n=1 Tax=Paraburkholderia sp. ZP32-5 TaxID=2883245 RepID=UPI001F444415|nr:hypothetical protein [Paraburkholderia sp. ZP32-5]
MTNTGKLLIIGLLVIDAGVAGYLLFPKDDERAPTASGVVVGSIDEAAQGERSGSVRVAGGSVIPEVPSKPAVPAAPVNPADKVAMAPSAPPSATPQAGAQMGGLPAQSAQSFGSSGSQQPGQSPAGLVPQQAMQPVAGAIPQQPMQPSLGAVSPQPTQSAANSAAPTPSAPAAPTVTALVPAPSVAPNSGQIATGRIDTTVQPAAQAKPKAQSTAQQKAQPKPGPRIDKTRRYAATPHPGGSNPVAASLTDQLVRESSKPDPSLPMPSGTSLPSIQTQTPPGRGSMNPVASAMTEQLVRESSKVAPIQQAPVPQPPMQQQQPPILKH